jgi:hypothetical protein
VRRRAARDLAALADGTLPRKRRAPLLRRVSDSPELAQALKQQLVAIEAIRRLDTPAPSELHERLQHAVREACATQQTALHIARAGARLIRSKRLGTPRC